MTQGKLKEWLMTQQDSTAREYEALIAEMPYLFVFKNKEGVYQNCSDAFAKKLGYPSKNNIIGKNDKELVWKSDHTSPDHHSHSPAALHEEKFIHQNGNKIAFSVTKKPVLDDDKQFIGEFIFYDEIAPTNEKKSLLNHFENIINYIPANIYWKDKNSIVIGCNNRWAMSAGFNDEEDMIGKTDAALPWADHANKIKSNEKEIMRSGLSRTFEETENKSDGSMSYYLTTKSPLFDENHKVYGIVGVSMDITERKLTEQALIKAQNNAELQKAYLDNIITHLPANVFWKNADSVIIGCNDRLAQCAGLEKATDIIGKSDYELPWKEQAESIIKNDQEVMQSGITRTYEEMGKLPDGTTATFLTIKAPLRDKKKKAIGVLGISVDITDRKAMEAATLDAKQKAEMATQLKSAFIENMQHDLRTPSLGVWTALADLVKEESASNKKERLKMVEKSAKRLFKLCTEVTDFDNIERNEHSVTFKKFELHKLINNVIDLYRTAADKKGLSLNCHIAQKVPAIVKTDNYRVQRVLINLIGNAIKFTPTGSITLNVSVLNQNKNEAVLRFEVSDTGIGIPQEKKDYIYEKFTRGTPANNGIYKGSGLGLRIVKRFIEELKGDIDIQSEPNKGTTFYITFSVEIPLSNDNLEPLDPINDIDPEEELELDLDKLPTLKKQDNKIILENDSSLDANKTHMLLIEDDALAMYAAESCLKSLGLQITTASSVEEAKEKLKQHKFDFVISDLGLPDGTGFDIVRYIKKDHTHSLNFNTPFFALTAHSGKEKELEAADAGFVTLMTKPMTVPRLTSILKKQASLPDTIIDWNFSKQQGFDDVTAKKLMDMLQNDLPVEVKNIKNAKKNNNIKQLREIMHKLKGSFCYCGVPKLRNVTNILHDAIKDTDSLDKIDHLFNDFYKEVNAFLKEYETVKA